MSSGIFDYPHLSKLPHSLRLIHRPASARFDVLVGFAVIAIPLPSTLFEPRRELAHGDTVRFRATPCDLEVARAVKLPGMAGGRESET